MICRPDEAMNAAIDCSSNASGIDGKDHSRLLDAKSPKLAMLILTAPKIVAGKDRKTLRKISSSSDMQAELYEPEEEVCSRCCFHF